MTGAEHVKEAWRQSLVSHLVTNMLTPSNLGFAASGMLDTNDT